MGLQASIDLSYPNEINFDTFIESMVNCGWSINDNKRITYLANDDFDWKNDDLNKQELIKKILFDRFLNNKIVGIALTLQNSTGGLFHFLPCKKEIMILLNINRVKLIDTQFTDYTFYINKLYPVIKDCLKLNYCDIL